MEVWSSRHNQGGAGAGQGQQRRVGEARGEAGAMREKLQRSAFAFILKFEKILD